MYSEIELICENCKKRLTIDYDKMDTEEYLEAIYEKNSWESYDVGMYEEINICPECDEKAQGSLGDDYIDDCYLNLYLDGLARDRGEI